MQRPPSLLRIAFWLLLIGIGLSQLAGGRRLIERDESASRGRRRWSRRSG